MSALDLHCFAWAFSICGEQGFLFAVLCGLLILVASLVAEHRPQIGRLQELQHVDSVVGAHGFTCSAACGIFLTRAGTHAPALTDGWVLIHCATREVPANSFFINIVCYHIRYLFFSLFLGYWISPKNNLGSFVPEIRHSIANLLCSLNQELSILYADQFHCPICKYACCGNTCLWLRKKKMCTLKHKK